MRGIRRTLNGPSVLPKKQQNHAVRLITRFTTFWRSEIYINLKIDADALHRRRRHFCFRCAIYYIKDSEGSMLISAHASRVHAT
jgi:hypothetical protein